MIGGNTGGIEMITKEQEEKLRKIANELKTEFSAVSLCVLGNEGNQHHVFSLYKGSLPEFAYILKQLDRHFAKEDTSE